MLKSYNVRQALLHCGEEIGAKDDRSRSRLIVNLEKVSSRKYSSAPSLRRNGLISTSEYNLVEPNITLPIRIYPCRYEFNPADPNITQISTLSLGYIIFSESYYNQQLADFDFQSVFLSMNFCEVYPVYASSKLCEFILDWSK